MNLRAGAEAGKCEQDGEPQDCKTAKVFFKLRFDLVAKVVLMSCIFVVIVREGER